MPQPGQLNPQLIDAVNFANGMTMSPSAIVTEGAGKAYQSVAQSAAIAVQDATDNLRNINTMATTAIGVALAQMLADPASVPLWTPVITAAQGVSTSGAALFATIGANAAQVLRGFPSGPGG